MTSSVAHGCPLSLLSLMPFLPAFAPGQTPANEGAKAGAREEPRASQLPFKEGAWVPFGQVSDDENLLM